MLLALLLIVPLIGAAVVTAVGNARAARTFALGVSLIVFVIGVTAAAQFDWHRDASSNEAAVQLRFGPGANAAVGSALAVTSVGFSISLGVDSVSMWLVLLTVFLTPLAIAASFDSIQTRAREYYAWMLVLLTAMLGVFVARDLLLFYVFFELTLIPMFFIIGIWGGPDRRRAAGKFFLFTFAGSVFTLAAVVYLGLHPGMPDSPNPSFALHDILTYAQSAYITPKAKLLVCLGLLAGFAVKVPLFPVHTWLPLAHTEAPTAGSVILAGVLLKLGTYGLMRLAIPVGFVTHGVEGTAFTNLGLLRFIGLLCVVGVIYGALCAWVQQDIKKLVAYSSVSHLGFCVLGLAALNAVGIQGSVFYMINHGLSTGAMFLVIGMIYDRYHTRDINQLSGLAKRMPIMAFFFVLFVMSSIGLPGTNGFASEFLTIQGAFASKVLGVKFGAFAALGVILGAVYMLHMTARVIFGPLKTPELHGEHGHGQEDQGQSTAPGGEHAGAHRAHHHHVKQPGDLNAREIGILVPIALAVLILGFVPNAVLKTIYSSTKLVAEVERTTPATAVVVAPAADVVAAK